MKIKLKTLICGPEGTFYPGIHDDLPVNLARTIIAGGYAEMIEEKTDKKQLETKQPEAAKIIPTETAVLRSPRGRKPGTGAPGIGKEKA